MKNIFFDLGRTVVEHPEDGAGLRIIKSLGITDEADATLLRNCIFSVAKFMNYLDENSISRDEYRARLLEEIPERLHSVALEAADYHITALPMVKGMSELLTELKEIGYSLYITSNLDAYHTAQMYTCPIADYFDGMIFSSEIGVRKPHREYFETACKKFGVAPETCLFIDDLEENVRGAEALGIKGFVFRGDAAEAREFIFKNS